MIEGINAISFVISVHSQNQSQQFAILQFLSRIPESSLDIKSILDTGNHILLSLKQNIFEYLKIPKENCFTKNMNGTNY